MENKVSNHIARITLSDTEVEVSVSNLAFRNLLVLLWSFAGKNKKIQGAFKLAKALKKPRDIRVFTAICDGSCYQCLRNYYNQKIHDDCPDSCASGRGI